MIRRTILSIITFLVASLAARAAHAQALDARSQAIVEQLTLERAATIAAMQRRADEREAALLAELGEQDRRLRETIAATSEAERTRDAARAELVRVTARRRALIAQIAGRDSRFAAEIAEYRAQIASIAASPDPRKRAALARYAAGDRSGALDVLIDIQNAETASIAAGWRDLAERAMDQYARRELSLDDTITIVSRAAAVAQSDTGLWRTLAGLLRQAGRNREAEEALSHVR